MTFSQRPSESSIEQMKVKDLEKDVEKNTELYDDSSDDLDHGMGLVRTASDPAFRRGSSTTIPQKTLGPYQAAIIFITNEIGIGILSLPATLNVLGIVPGIITIIAMGLLSLYSGYILVQFYRRYPTVVNLVDYGRILGGRPLEFIFAVGFIINLSLICASAVITMSIGFNTITEHALCTVGFIAIPAIICWLLCIPRTMKFVAWCGWPCTVSIVSAVLIVMISLGVAGPQNAPPRITIKVIGDPTFTQATSAFLNIAFAYTGNQAFPSVLAEMRDPSRDFPKAICIEKCFAILMYTIVAVVCYSLAGEAITSPAIGSAPITIAKIAYGIIFVSLFGTGLVFGHTATKYLHVVTVRQFTKSKLKQSKPYDDKLSRSSQASTLRPPPVTDPLNPPLPPNTSTNKCKLIQWPLWILLGTFFWILVFILANAIPVFDSLLNISASVLLAWFTWGLPAVFWLHLNWTSLWTTWTKKVLCVLNVFMLLVTLFMNSGGLYASVNGLLAVFGDERNSVNGPFSCGDNSIF